MDDWLFRALKQRDEKAYRDARKVWKLSRKKKIIFQRYSKTQGNGKGRNESGRGQKSQIQ